MWCGAAMLLQWRSHGGQQLLSSVCLSIKVCRCSHPHQNRGMGPPLPSSLACACLQSACRAAACTTSVLLGLTSSCTCQLQLALAGWAWSGSRQWAGATGSLLWFRIPTCPPVLLLSSLPLSRLPLSSRVAGASRRSHQMLNTGKTGTPWGWLCLLGFSHLPRALFNARHPQQLNSRFHKPGCDDNVRVVLSVRLLQQLS